MNDETKLKLDLTINTPLTEVDRTEEATTARTPVGKDFVDDFYDENDEDSTKQKISDRNTQQELPVKYKNNILNYYFNEKSGGNGGKQAQKYSNPVANGPAKTYRVEPNRINMEQTDDSYFSANKPTSRLNFNENNNEVADIYSPRRPSLTTSIAAAGSPLFNNRKPPNTLPPIGNDASQDILNSDESGYSASSLRSPLGRQLPPSNYRTQLIGNVASSNIDLAYTNLPGT